jgi:hypothetical protein
MPRIAATFHGTPCRKNPEHVVDGYTLKYGYGKSNCALCERERIVILSQKRKRERRAAKALVECSEEK